MILSSIYTNHNPTVKLLFTPSDLPGKSWFGAGEIGTERSSPTLLFFKDQ
jgi:hypothetical protein